MSTEYSTEYYIKGRFPESPRILLIGPRRQTFTTLTVHHKCLNENGPLVDNHIYSGELEVDGKKIKGRIIFENNLDGNSFKTKQELFDFLKKHYHLTYLRDKSRPAVDTGG